MKVRREVTASLLKPSRERQGLESSIMSGRERRDCSKGATPSFSWKEDHVVKSPVHVQVLPCEHG